MLITVCDALFLKRQVIDHQFQVDSSPTSLSEVVPEVDIKQVGSELSIHCALPVFALVCILGCLHLFSLTVEVLSPVVLIFLILWQVLSRVWFGASILLCTGPQSSTSSTSVLL